jgi:hypothetical protein
MKLDSMIQETRRLIEDKGYDSVTLTEKINNSLNFCCREVDVPDLKNVFTVSTSTSVGYVSLKEKIVRFGGRVKRVKYDGADLRRYTSLDEMLMNYDDLETAGDIEAFCQEGQILWYVKIPETAISLLVLCYQAPTPLSVSNQEIGWMPDDDIEKKILVGGACAEIFDELEEEDSGKPVARRYESMRNEGIMELRAWISKNRQNISYSCWSQ